MLVDRGELDLDATVSAYWPEFAARGQAGIQVRQISCRIPRASGGGTSRSRSRTCTTGTIRPPCSPPRLLVGTRDGLRLPRVLLRPPGWRSDPAHHWPAPGQLCRAHCGADRRRLPHRPAALGVPARRQRRRRRRAPAPADPMQPDTNSVAFKTMTNPTMSPETTWTQGWRRTDIGAGNGHGNARSLRPSRGRWPAAAWSMASGCFRPRRSTESSRCNSTGSTS